MGARSFWSDYTRARRVSLIAAMFGVLVLGGCSSEVSRFNSAAGGESGSAPIPKEPVYGYNGNGQRTSSFQTWRGHTHDLRARRASTHAAYYSTTTANGSVERTGLAPVGGVNGRANAQPIRVAWRERTPYEPRSDADPGYYRPYYGDHDNHSYPRPLDDRYRTNPRRSVGDTRSIPRYITVAPGDTVYSIAMQTGVSVGALIEANDLPTAAIQPGQRLLIPPQGASAYDRGPRPPYRQPLARRRAAPSSPPVETRPNSYRVHTGDTLYSIAQHFGISTRELARHNNIGDPSMIHVGQLLYLPGARARGYADPSGHRRRPSYNDPYEPRRQPARRRVRAHLPEPPSHSPTPAHRAPERRYDERSAQSYERGGNGHEDAPMVLRSEKGDPLRNDRRGGPDYARRKDQDRIAGAPSDDPRAAGREQRLAAREDREADRPSSPRSCADLLAHPPARSAGMFRRPVEGLVISSFGPQADGTRNDGINISVPRGTPVKAAANGVVTYAGDELSGYGNLVLIRHADGWVSAYAHNDAITVRRCDVVRRGEVIARTGMSGTVNKPQLHFELRKDQRPVDPKRYVAGGTS